MKERKISEEKTVGASYILQFYQDVLNLTHSSSQYANLLLEFENKYGEDEKGIAALDENERQALTSTVQEVRYWANRSYIAYAVINRAIPSKLRDEEEANRMREIHEAIKRTFIIPRDVLEEYNLLLNGVLVKKVVRNLLESSSDLISEVYGG